MRKFKGRGPQVERRTRAQSTNLFVTMTRKQQDQAKHWVSRVFPTSTPDERIRYGIYEHVKAGKPLSVALIDSWKAKKPRTKVSPAEIGQIELV